MENRMRDLDQIQEHEGDERSRRMGTILLATAAVVGLTFAIGVVVGQAAESGDPDVKDPLAQLESTALAQPAATAVKAPNVEAADLSFPQALAEDEERPEVLAALEAAEREEAALAEPEAGDARLAAQAPEVTPTVAGEPEGVDAEDSSAEITLSPPSPAEPEPADVNAEDIAAVMPAGVSAAAETLPRSAQHDPLVAQAIASEPRRERAPRGREGEYTLQVISYDSEEPARAFAEGLRSRGHEAFVMRADIPERGCFYRVRIGPFENRWRAENYRKKFEEEERMNTFVVRKRD